MTIRYGLLLAALAVPATARAQTAADSSAIRATALDYVEGWYEGNGERMSRAVHPELVKRIVVADTATKRSVVETMGASALVNGARRGWGKKTPADRRQKDVTILDIFGNAASVKAVMADWIDYLQIAKVDGRWVIVNVLWEQKPEGKE
jgi:Putative lumazine-binding